MIMKVYRINYFAPLHITDLDDTYIAKSKFEAVKAFLVKYKGKYLVHCSVKVKSEQIGLRRKIYTTLKIVK